MRVTLCATLLVLLDDVARRQGANMPVHSRCARSCSSAALWDGAVAVTVLPRMPKVIKRVNSHKQRSASLRHVHRRGSQPHSCTSGQFLFHGPFCHNYTELHLQSPYVTYISEGFLDLHRNDPDVQKMRE